MQVTNVESMDVTNSQDEDVIVTSDAKVKKVSEKMKEGEVKKDAENRSCKSTATGAYPDEKVGLFLYS